LAKRQSNALDADKVRRYVGTIEEYERDLESKKGAYMAECKSVRSDISDIYVEAKAQGVPMKELKRVVKTRVLERRTKKLRDDLDSDGQENYDQIIHALGGLAELPLGAIVADRARSKRDATEGNVVALEKGIKPLRGDQAPTYDMA
jgi:uncharacterized protein (UPF0335 family)